ncbi:protein translocase subunit YajC [Ameyamaea chiangmaiensis NBRC 103196]|nr:protein translocase subunit YajC [Ameyamaea chiangmaiensis NBRC 103196]
MTSLFISPAYAQSAGGGAFSSAGLIAMAPYLLIFVVFYFLLIRPQQQKQKQLRSQLSGLRRGDRVVTAGGIVGVVQKVREGSSEIDVEIAPNVRVIVLRDTISTILSSTAKPANDSAEPAKKA